MTLMVSRVGLFRFMGIQLTQDLEELKAQAEGALPFVPNALFDKLAEQVGEPEYWRLSPTERLKIGYYLAAKRRVELLAAEARA